MNSLPPQPPPRSPITLNGIHGEPAKNIVERIFSDRISWLLGLLGLVMVMLGFLLYAQANRPTARITPIRYDNIEVSPVAVCPGDVLTYSFRVRILTAPTVLTSAESWWNMDKQYTEVPGTRFLSAIYTEPVTITRNVTITIPLSLAPGHHEYRRAAIDSPDRFTTFVVPVTVAENCGKAQGVGR